MFYKDYYIWNSSVNSGTWYIQRGYEILSTKNSLKSAKAFVTRLSNKDK